MLTHTQYTTHSFSLFNLFPQRFFRMRVITITTAANTMMRLTATTDPPMMATVEEDAGEHNQG